MAAATYYARTLLSGDDVFAQEQLNSDVTAHPYHNLPVVLGVMNQTDSGKVVRVRYFNTRAMTTAQSTAAMLNIQRISAASEPAFGTSITAWPLDSASSALPSQVECLYAPRNVTIVSGSVLRRVMVQTELNFTRALGTFVAQTQGDSRSGNDSGEFYRSADADTQKIVLREGEGIGLDYVGTNAMALHAYSVTIVASVGGETWRFNRVIEPRMADSGMVLSLMNGSGSGVVLEVKRVQVREIGTDDEPLVYYERIEQLDPDAATPDVTPMDSAIPLPAGVIVRSNASAMRAGAKSGALIAIPVQRRIQLTEAPWYVGSAGISGLTRRAKFVTDLQFPTDNAIVLRPGHGFSIRKRFPSAKCAHEVQLLFDVQDEVTGGGTFPDPGDVRDGEVYGPTDDLTGTLVVPAEGDVRLGTDYGADGVEFTGTLDPGGGGGGTFPATGEVEAGVVYGPTDNLTGTLVVPAEDDVRSGVAFGPASALSGDLALPVVSDVRAGVGYGADGTEATGNVVVPEPADVRLGTPFGAAGALTGELDPGGGGGGATGTVYLRRGR